jgi:hypothetical protein
MSDKETPIVVQVTVPGADTEEEKALTALFEMALKPTMERLSVAYIAGDEELRGKLCTQARGVGKLIGRSLGYGALVGLACPALLRAGFDGLSAGLSEVTMFINEHLRNAYDEIDKNAAEAAERKSSN